MLRETIITTLIGTAHDAADHLDAFGDLRSVILRGRLRELCTLLGMTVHVELGDKPIVVTPEHDDMLCME